MVLAEIASIITIANFSSKLLSQLKKKKPKNQKRKTVNRRKKQSKEDEMIKKLLADPTQAVKEIGAEYVVQNRKRIIKNIEKCVVDEFLE